MVARVHTAKGRSAPGIERNHPVPPRAPRGRTILVRHIPLTPFVSMHQNPPPDQFGPGPLLIPQRHHRVHTRGAARGKIAREQRHSAQQHGHRGEDRRIGGFHLEQQGRHQTR